MSFKLYNGDCLEVMKAIPDNSIDLIFCDLPYGCTSCKWDCPIDLDKLWLEYMRIKKLNAPIFLTTTTKFGVSLINSAPKKCPFRYDLIWVKSAPAGFLCAKKMPMRKHEMMYVFYEKLPFYDLSSHKHKFIKHKENTAEESKTDTYGKLKRCNDGKQGKYTPPLPVSVIKEESFKNGTIDGNKVYEGKKVLYRNKSGLYDPPLPTSILEIASQRSKHSTQKPVDLMKWIFKYYSKENDIILDNCMGSGSTGVACKEMNRRFIGIEMDKDIFKVAEERLN